MSSQNEAVTHGNCWTYAVPKWLKNPKYTYLVVRWSRYSWWPHVMFTESIAELQVEEFVPNKPQRGLRGFFNAIWFKGHVRKGKGER